MKKILFPILLIILLSACDFDKLPGNDPPLLLLPNNADFIALSGTRLKTFRWTPEPTQLEFPVTVTFSGNGLGLASDLLTSQHYVSFTNKFTVTVPLSVICFPSNYIASFSGRFHYNDFNQDPFYMLGNMNLSVQKPYSEYIPAVNPDYLEYEIEAFTCDSYIIPEKGYIADKNAFRIHNYTFSQCIVSEAQAAALFNLNFWFYPCALSLEPFSYTFFYRQVSRDFYLYRSISITFAPDVEVFGWQAHDGNISEIIDRFEFDPETNTLTAYFKDYLDNTLGDVFSFYVIAEDGSVKTKTISIGYASESITITD